MLFSSVQFLFAFLPVCLAVYYLVHKNRLLSNIVLTLFSCFFYAYGEPKFVYIMVAITVVDWLAAIGISRSQGKVFSTGILGLTLLVNLGVLFLYKYLDFVITQLNFVTHADIPLRGIAMPIGISFFTFQSISYVIDVYRGKEPAQENPLYVVEYIALFPQLIAGPIVRYSDVAHELTERRECLADFEDGCCRFITGLGKKVLLANSMAVAADAVFDSVSGGGSVAVLTAWVGAIAYSLQIYFDFSGYSDMAIGLGRMFGFHFLENFNYPYISRSITEFWRRWHMSLQTWFRDYVYIPLGGNRVSVRRRNLNLFIVWLLTGIWHGANWTFIAWGLMYWVLLQFEKRVGLNTRQNVFTRVYTLFFVMVGWIIFRSTSLTAALRYIGMLFGAGSAGVTDVTFTYIVHEYGLLLLLACVGSTPAVATLTQKLEERRSGQLIYIILEGGGTHSVCLLPG